MLCSFLLDRRLSATKEQTSSWNTLANGLRREKKNRMSCYWSQLSSFYFKIGRNNFTVYTSHLLEGELRTKKKTHETCVFRLNWYKSNKVKSLAKPCDQRKQTIKWNCFVFENYPNKKWRVKEIEIKTLLFFSISRNDAWNLTGSHRMKKCRSQY